MGNDLDLQYFDFLNFKMEKAREFYKFLGTNCQYQDGKEFSKSHKKQIFAGAVVAGAVVGGGLIYLGKSLYDEIEAGKTQQKEIEALNDMNELLKERINIKEREIARTAE